MSSGDTGGPPPPGERRRRRRRRRRGARPPGPAQLPGQPQPALGRPPAQPLPPRPSRPQPPPRAPSTPAEGALPPPDPDLDAGWDMPAQPAPSAQHYGYDDEGEALIPPLRLLQGPPAPPPDPDGDDVFAELDETEPPRGLLCNLAGIKFREAGKIYEFDAGDLVLARGENVVVDTEAGLALGIVAVGSARRLSEQPLRRVLRRADQNDQRQMARNRGREQEALEFGRERVRERRLDMKLFRVEYLHGGYKAIFYFTSEARIDFRDLVKDLSHRLHARIEMRQIGVRDEAKMVGGIGDCGRELCCSTWLPQFAPVSIRMAKDQGIVLNPSRVSGQCGRLKCCLVYEEAQYRELRKGMPKVGKRVETPEGEGRVQELDVLGRRVRVSFLGGGSKLFAAETVRPLVPPQGAPPVPEPDEGGENEPPPGVPTE